MPRYLTTEEVAATHGCTVVTITRNAMIRGIKPTKKIGCNYLWRTEDVQQLKPGTPGRKKKTSRV